MDPITIAILAAAAVAALAVVVVVLLKWDDIINWFRQRNDIKEADKDNIAFTLKDRLNNGNYKVVQGIFNKRTDKIVEGKVVEAKKLDSELAEVHRDQELAIYD